MPEKLISIKNLDPAVVLVTFYNKVTESYAKTHYKKVASDEELLDKAARLLKNQTHFEVLDLGRGYRYVPVNFHIGPTKSDTIDVTKYEQHWGEDKTKEVIDELEVVEQPSLERCDTFEETGESPPPQTVAAPPPKDNDVTKFKPRYLPSQGTDSITPSFSVGVTDPKSSKANTI